uniref:Uncharacterized protein n=1 Tax=Oryza punctata TaxID=4537 RepID=A0A0E0LAY9_ORYPU
MMPLPSPQASLTSFGSGKGAITGGGYPPVQPDQILDAAMTEIKRWRGSEEFRQGCHPWGVDVGSVLAPVHHGVQEAKRAMTLLGGATMAFVPGEAIPRAHAAPGPAALLPRIAFSPRRNPRRPDPRCHVAVRCAVP